MVRDYTPHMPTKKMMADLFESACRPYNKSDKSATTDIKMTYEAGELSCDQITGDPTNIDFASIKRLIITFIGEPPSGPVDENNTNPTTRAIAQQLQQVMDHTSYVSINAVTLTQLEAFAFYPLNV